MTESDPNVLRLLRHIRLLLTVLVLLGLVITVTLLYVVFPNRVFEVSLATGIAVFFLAILASIFKLMRTPS